MIFKNLMYIGASTFAVGLIGKLFYELNIDDAISTRCVESISGHSIMNDAETEFLDH